MRKTDVVVSNKRLFSNAGGIGPSRIGTEEWLRGKERNERIQNYHQQQQPIIKPAMGMMPIFMNF